MSVALEPTVSSCSKARQKFRELCSPELRSGQPRGWKVSLLLERLYWGAVKSTWRREEGEPHYGGTLRSLSPHGGPEEDAGQTPSWSTILSFSWCSKIVCWMNKWRDVCVLAVHTWKQDYNMPIGIFAKQMDIRQSNYSIFRKWKVKIPISVHTSIMLFYSYVLSK